MAKKLYPADVVKLLSGGPEIVIEDYHRDIMNREIIEGKFVCVWIDDNKQEHREIYPENILTLIR